MLSGGHNNSVILLYVGRLGVEKNLDILKTVLEKIELQRSLYENIPNIELAFIGTGPADKQLRELFKPHKNVHFIGQLTGSYFRI